MSRYPLPLPKAPALNDVVIESVISNMCSALQAMGIDESKVQEMKPIWRARLQNTLHGNPTDGVPNTNADTMSADITKKVLQGAAEVLQGAAGVTGYAAAVTGAVPPGIPWVLKEIEMPHLLRYPLVRRKTMDGGLPPIKEETSDEDVEDESLNCGDGPPGDEAGKGGECDRSPI